MRILGIDPGLRITGYACVEVPDPASSRPGRRREISGSDSIALVEAGVIRLKASRPTRRRDAADSDAKAPTRSIAQRLLELDRDLAEVIDRLAPAVVAVERLYAHYKHPTTAIIMGHARGVVLLAVQRAGLQLVELGATAVKKSLTGHGHAGKRQMQDAVVLQMALAACPEPPDVADAIAIALCAARRLDAPVTS